MVLQTFSIKDSKPTRRPLANNFRLSKDQCSETDEEKDFMAKVSYALTIRSLMYGIVCTRPDIAHAARAASRFMSNPGKQH